MVILVVSGVGGEWFWLWWCCGEWCWWLVVSGIGGE